MKTFVKESHEKKKHFTLQLFVFVLKVYCKASKSSFLTFKFLLIKHQRRQTLQAKYEIIKITAPLKQYTYINKWEHLLLTFHIFVDINVDNMFSFLLADQI